MKKRVKIYSSITVLLIVALGLYLFYYNQPPVTATDTKTGVGEQINQLIDADPLLQGAVASISIRSGTSGEILYQHLGDTRLRPASNMKLLTAAAALSVLGEDYRFKTELHMSGSIKGNKLEGNLYLKGKGDPTLLKTDFDNMAKKLKQTGITSISGDLIGDDTWFDDMRYPIDMPWSDEQAYYGAQTSALTASPDKDFDAGTVILEISPGHNVGEEGIITLTPHTDIVKIVNHTVTVSPEESKHLTFERKHGTNTVIVEGTIPVNSTTSKDWVALWEPTTYALDLFNQALAEQGITVNGQVITGETPNKTKLLLSHSSITISELLIPFMKLSNNVHAETLVKEMGKVVTGIGSWDKGLEVLKKEVEKFGLNPETLFLRDGSGISHVTLIPANEISELLFSIQNEDWFPAYLKALPVAGVPKKMVGGSLRYRMIDSKAEENVRAKTGTLTTVSSLSGYVTTKQGEKLIFSIIINNVLDESKAKQIEDQIADILANS